MFGLKKYGRKCEGNKIGRKSIRKKQMKKNKK